MDHGLTIESHPDYPGRWVVMGELFGHRVAVFEANVYFDELNQIAECQSYVMEAVNESTD